MPTRQGILFEASDQCVVLGGISLKTYRRMEAEIGDRPVPHLVYWEGELEIMSPSRHHELLAALLCKIVEICAEATGWEIVDNRQTTLKRSDIQGGVEPDGSFHIRNASRVAKTGELDFSQDPPPDLVVEVDLTSKSTKKVKTNGFYAKLGVPEIWRCDVRSEFRSRFGILVLDGNAYKTSEQSAGFPELTADLIRRTISEFESNGQAAALKMFKREFRKVLKSKPTTD